jgi:hypothetical protein
MPRRSILATLGCTSSYIGLNTNISQLGSIVYHAAVTFTPTPHSLPHKKSPHFSSEGLTMLSLFSIIEKRA